MREISERELWDELRKVVELLAAEAPVQLAWLDENRYPSDELMLSLDDAKDAWFRRLEEAGLLTATVKESLLSLLEFLLSLQDPALWQSDGALVEAPEWREIRLRAGKSLAVMDASLGPS